MQTLDFDFGRIAYQQMGQGEPLLLVHGFPTSSYLFHRLMPLLAQHFHVYALDLMGYGASEVPRGTPLHIEAQTEMIGQFAARLGLTPFTLVGHDLGGGIGQIIGLEHSAWVRRMVFINSIMLDNFPIPRIQRLLNWLERPLAKPMLRFSPFLDWWAGSSSGLKAGVVDKGAMDKAAIHQMIYAPFLASMDGIEGFFDVVKAQAENGRITRRLRARLHQMDVPTLILHGNQDPWFPPDQARQLFIILKGATGYEMIAGAGHFCPLEKPQEISQQIIQFCQQT